MPGIVGLITQMPRARAVDELSRMVKALCHETLYETGTWVDEVSGIYVGWVTRKGSFSDGMPLTNERGDTTLIFSGEEYPEPGTKEELEKKGHLIDGKQSSYLVHMYEEDPNFLVRLNGMFHGVLVDRAQGATTLFNDRYGMHRLFYHESKEAFYFAAEAKGILAVRPELRSPDPQGLGEFVSCSCVLQDRTIFKGINSLPGGSAWVFRGGQLEKRNFYFHPREWEEQGALSPDSYYTELRNALSENLPRYFDGDEPLGIALTGGLDTRVIMAWRKPAPQTLHCYTFGGMFRDSEDVTIARKIASICNQSHGVITADEEFLKRFSHYAERSMYLTEGGVDVYRSSDLYVSEKARAIAPVKIVGTYGSEIVRQAVMFKPMPAPGKLFSPEFLSQVQKAADTYQEIRKEHPVTFAAFRQSPWYHHGILALEQSQLTVRSPYLDNKFVQAVYRAPRLNGAGEDVRLRLIADGSQELARLRTDRGVSANPGRLSGAASRGFLEFTFKAEYAYDYGMPQWVSRIDHALAPLHLERLFLGRHKFTHYRVWYRDILSTYVREMLLDSRTLSRPYLNRKSVEAIVEGHTKGGRNHTTEIHKLLTLELLQRLFFDSQ